MHPTDQILVVGAGPLGRLTERSLRDRSKRRAVFAHLRFVGEPVDARLATPVLGTVQDLEDVLNKYPVDEVYFAPGSPSDAIDTQQGVATCERLGVQFALPACGGYRLARAVVADHAAVADGYFHYLSVKKKPLQRALKRLLDVVVSATALVVLAPLLVVAALAVKLSSSGPVLFGQERVGMRGRPFRMLKFRSMVANAEDLQAGLLASNERTGPVFKLQRDPRVTRVGRFLRKYSIDELPQLLNVLRGEMSLVGPRPALAQEVARYAAWQRRRLSVRPGLTCVWQVSGRNAVSFGSWMVLDMRYIDHWSLADDLRLILRTVPVVLSGRGAS
jgi:exopolysaccharide biosynthesis polyprenyl glycosylphosphotransferase